MGGSHQKVPVSFTYAAESDRVRYPFGVDTRIEGGRNSGGDMHAIVVDNSTCRLYETWNTRVRNGGWVAGSGATWSLKSNALRREGWTSADAAGLPILPGLLRWNEVKAGRIGHAIRFTTDVTSRHHLWPAKHDAGSQDSLAYPPMGARFRLKASYPLTGYGRLRPSDRDGDEALRPRPRRQRIAVVLPGRAERRSGPHRWSSSSSASPRRSSRPSTPPG